MATTAVPTPGRDEVRLYESQDGRGQLRLTRWAPGDTVRGITVTDHVTGQSLTVEFERSELLDLMLDLATEVKSM